jgi:hypothetical protein
MYTFLAGKKKTDSIKQTQIDSVHYLFCNYGVEINLEIMFTHT